MNKKVFDAMYAFLDANNGFTVYKIDGYFGFAYLTIEWADGPKKYKFICDIDTGIVNRETV
jgi:hypothetical protein